MSNDPSRIVVTIQELDAFKALMNERDRRYDDNRKCDQDAVKLAKEIADKAKGTVNVVGLIAVISLILAVMDRLK